VSVARGGFEELLRTYPTYEDAPEAMVYIAETYAAERNQVAADSVYGLVVQRYPRSPKAATALYKRAQILRSAGQAAAARAALERIVREYPRSDEAALAREQLRTLGK
jgi:TolA-binding protein